MYTDSVEICDPNESVELLMVCNEFCLENLRKLCEIFVRLSLEQDHSSELTEDVCDTAVNAFQGLLVLSVAAIVRVLLLLCFSGL